MPRTVLLNTVDHAGLRVHTQPSAARGDDGMLVTCFPGEFRQLLAHYPIVFRKPPDAASFEPVAHDGGYWRRVLPDQQDFLGRTLEG